MLFGNSARLSRVGRAGSPCRYRGRFSVCQHPARPASYTVRMRGFCGVVHYVKEAKPTKLINGWAVSTMAPISSSRCSILN
jgi:hypothetical protein